MTRFAYLHEVDRSGEWHVFPCLLLRTSHEHILNKLRRLGQLIYIDRDGGIRITQTEHYSDRTSAVYWVLDTEFETMYRDIEADWNNRQLWRACYREAREVAIRQGLVSPEVRS